MKTLTLATVVTASALLATTVEARTSSQAEFRGYTACVDAVSQSKQGLVPSRNYYMQKEGAVTRYFINATHWSDGERAPLRIDCRTELRGSKLIDAQVADGMFTHVSRSKDLDIAQK